MNPAEYYRRKIAQAAERSQEASRRGDYPAFEAAEQDKAAYQAMLQQNARLSEPPPKTEPS